MDTYEVAGLEPAVPFVKPLLLFAGALVTLALLPHHDAGRVVPGLPCSLVTEREASQALHADVVLEPSDGHWCRFVSTEFGGDDVALVIVARQDQDVPAPAGSQVRGGTEFVVSNGRHSALVFLEDKRDGPALRDQTARELEGLVAQHLAARNAASGESVACGAGAALVTPRQFCDYGESAKDRLLSAR